MYLIVQENISKMFKELILCTSKSLMVFQVKFNVSEKKKKLGLGCGSLIKVFIWPG